MIQQLLPETVLVLSALVALAAGVSAGRKRPAGLPAHVAVAIAAAGILSALLALWLSPAAGLADGSPLLSADPLARIMKALVLGLGLLAVCLPPARGEIEHPGEYTALQLFALTGLSLAVGSSHLLMIFVALELAGLSLYLLAGFPRSARAAEASLKYFLFGGVSAAFRLYGLSLLYGSCHGLTFAAVAAVSPQSTLAMAGLAMILAGLGFKLAAMPFHAWAPDVYQGAPATTVGLVAAASKVAGLVVAIRLLHSAFPQSAGSAAFGSLAAGWAPWLAVLAAVSMIGGNLLALAQTSVRRLLAYSAVANAGYLLVALAGGGTAGAGATLFYSAVYGLATFGVLAITAAVEREQGDDSLPRFAGLAKRSPWQAACLLVCLVSLAGIPPMAGFFGKFALFAAALADAGTGLAWLVALAAILSAVSLYYYLRILKQAFVKSPPESLPESPPPLPISHRLAIALPAALLILLGLLPDLLLHPLTTALQATLAGPPP